MGTTDAKKICLYLWLSYVTLFDIDQTLADDLESESEQEEDVEEGMDAFMSSYSDALSKELKSSTLNNTFVHAQSEESSAKKDEVCKTQYYIVHGLLIFTC